MALGDTELEKYQLYYHKYPISIDDVHFDKILSSNKISFG